MADDRDPREILEMTWQQIGLGENLNTPKDRKDYAHMFSQALIDLLPSITVSQARLIREAIEAAYQLGRMPLP